MDPSRITRTKTQNHTEPYKTYTKRCYWGPVWTPCQPLLLSPSDLMLTWQRSKDSVAAAVWAAPNISLCRLCARRFLIFWYLLSFNRIQSAPRDLLIDVESPKVQAILGRDDLTPMEFIVVVDASAARTDIEGATSCLPTNFYIFLPPPRLRPGLQSDFEPLGCCAWPPKKDAKPFKATEPNKRRMH